MDFPESSVDTSNGGSTCVIAAHLRATKHALFFLSKKHWETPNRCTAPIHQITRFVSKLCAGAGQTQTISGNFLSSPTWTKRNRKKDHLHSSFHAVCFPHTLSWKTHNLKTVGILLSCEKSDNTHYTSYDQPHSGPSSTSCIQSTSSIHNSFRIITSAKKLVFWPLSVWLSAGLLKHYWKDFHETEWKDAVWVRKEPNTFWWWLIYISANFPGNDSWSWRSWYLQYVWEIWGSLIVGPWWMYVLYRIPYSSAHCIRVQGSPVSVLLTGDLLNGDICSASSVLFYSYGHYGDMIKPDLQFVFSLNCKKERRQSALHTLPSNSLQQSLKTLFDPKDFSDSVFFPSVYPPIPHPRSVKAIVVVLMAAIGSERKAKVSWEQWSVRWTHLHAD